ncbi:MAG: MBL fold metallo-hydrolase [Spirochaetes bacterium]|nr:MBL fold metallo-hydrolase [Spirochaetota bacterium]
MNNTIKQISDEIYGIYLPLPFSSVKQLSIYFIDGDKPALIDTGLGDIDSLNTISRLLKTINRNITDVSYIINTHEHIEHFSGNKKIKQACGGFSIASSAAAEFLDNFHTSTEELKANLPSYDPELAEEIRNIIARESGLEIDKIDKRVKDGDYIDTGKVRLRVISTPGHAKGHICLYEEDRKILFTGDHILSKQSTFVGYDFREIISHRIKEIFNKNNGELDNLTLYIESIKKLEALDINIILPGHGAPITDPYKKMALEIKKKERRSEIFYKLLEKENEIGLKKLTQKIYGEKNSGFLHMGSTLGYLARMNRNGIINVILKNDEPFITLNKN